MCTTPIRHNYTLNHVCLRILSNNGLLLHIRVVCFIIPSHQTFHHRPSQAFQNDANIIHATVFCLPCYLLPFVNVQIHYMQNVYHMRNTLDTLCTSTHSTPMIPPRYGSSPKASVLLPPVVFVLNSTSALK